MNNLIRILPQTFRRRGYAVAATLLLRAVLNFLGLALLLPVLVLVLDPASTTQGSAMAEVYRLGEFASRHSFVLAICGAVVAIIALKCLINIWLYRFERNYILDLYRTLSRQLYTTYQNRGLAFIKKSNSAILARNVNVISLAFTTGVLRPAAMIAAETILFLLLFGALTLYSPAAALLTLAIFIPVCGLYYLLVRKRIDRYGKQENKAQREKAKLVTETFRGYADIQINDAFPMMLQRFDLAMDQVIDTRKREATINMLPQSLTEIGLAAGVALLAAMMAGDEGHTPLLFGAFAVAALRLMPSVRNVMAAWTSIKYNRYTLDVLLDAEADISAANTAHSESAHTPSPNPNPASERPATASDFDSADLLRAASPCVALRFEQAITIRGLYFSFDAGQELFNGLTLDIRKGERVGIRGASGSGKTTLFNLLLGLYTPDQGEIAIDGVPLTAQNRRAWQNHIGYVSQQIFLCDGSFAQNVALGHSPAEMDRQRVAQALEEARLGEFIASLPQGMDTPIGECGCRLSGGQRQRIGIARALYRQADVLFFDEATSALDTHTEEQVNRSIIELTARMPGLTLVTIAHRESSLDYCDRIITIGKN